MAEPRMSFKEALDWLHNYELKGATMKKGDIIRVYVGKDAIKEVIFNCWLNDSTLEYKLGGQFHWTHYKNIVN